MKRSMRVVALLLALVTVFSFPASAEDWDNVTSYNVLDYCTIEDSGTNSYSLSNGNYPALPLPAYTVVRGVDLLVYSNTSNLNMQINSGSSTNWYEMERQSLGNGIIRFYNFSLPGYRHEELNFYLTYDSGSYVEFLRVDLYQAKSYHFAETGTLYVSDTYASGTYTMESTTDTVKHTFYKTDATVYTPFWSSMSCSSWKKYDYLDFQFCLDSNGIESISARFAGINIPFEVSYSSSSEYGSYVSYKYVRVRIDLRGLDRSKTDVPVLEVTGTLRSDYDNFIALTQVSGYVVGDSVDPLVYFFSELESSFSEDFAVLQARMDAIGEELAAMHTNMKTYISNLQTALVNKLTSIRDTMVSQYNGMITFLTDTMPVRIAEEISKVFVPSEGKIEQVQQESQELAQERLGAVYQSTQIIDSLAGAFEYQSTQGTVAFPSVTIDLAGVPFTFGGWDVQLVPDGFGGFVETLKYVIDIVCTIGFAQALKRRFEKVMEA